MDFNTTVDLIIKDLNEAGKIIDDFRNYPGVPVLQVELARAKCRSAAEVIALFKNIQETPVTEIKKEPYLPPEASLQSDAPVQNQNTSPLIPDEEVITIKKKVAESAILADTFSNRPDSLNKKLGNLRDDGDISGRMNSKPLTNLSDAIGVNDKFLFIREVFNGNPESYNKVISRLDGVESFADAKAIIMSNSDRNADTEAVRQLLDLVKRKYPADE